MTTTPRVNTVLLATTLAWVTACGVGAAPFLLSGALRGHLDPKRVGVLRVGGQIYGEDVRRGVLVLVLMWIIVFVAASIALAAMGLGFRNALGAAAATLNTVGPSIGETLFADMLQPARVLLIACMLLGRLEIMTVVLLVISALSRAPGR